MLKNSGILAFIVPKSFLNSIYYSKILNYIVEHFTIVSIYKFEEINNFIDTNQSTIGLVIQNIKPTNDCLYSMRLNDNYIFTDNLLELKSLFYGSTTLNKMGLKVKTGTIVWNKHKSELTEDSSATLLVYNTNVSKQNTLKIHPFKNKEKKQFIRKNGQCEPVLVVNRGNGNSNYNLTYALIDNVRPFLIENHLNEIYPERPFSPEILNELYKKIITSFRNPKTQIFINRFLGNNSLSKTELETIFPIYYE
jgi:hypothetical protein